MVPHIYVQLSSPQQSLIDTARSSYSAKLLLLVLSYILNKGSEVRPKT